MKKDIKNEFKEFFKFISFVIYFYFSLAKVIIKSLLEVCILYVVMFAFNELTNSLNLTSIFFTMYLIIMLFLNAILEYRKAKRF